MKLVKNRLFVILVGLCVASATVAQAATFKIEVFKGSSTTPVVTQTFSPVAGVNNKQKATFVLPDYTGNAKDYTYKVSQSSTDPKAAVFKMGESNGQVPTEVSGTDYLKENTCADKKFSVCIWTDSGSKNYYPHEFICTGGAGNEPKDLVISVYKEGGFEKKFNFVKVPGTTTYEYEAQVTIDGYTGNPNDYKYWVGANNAWENGKSCNFQLGTKNSQVQGCSGDASAYAADNFLATCTSGSFTIRIFALNNGTEQWAPNYYAHALKEVKVAGLLLTSSVPSIETSALPAKITLSAQETEAGMTEGNFQWFYSTDKTNWKPLPGAGTGNSVVLQPNAFPKETTYYQVKRKLVGETKLVESNIRPLVVIQACGENTKGKKIYKEDFGQLATLTARAPFAGMSANYKYRPYPRKINDGQYALVATPYYCGCGEGSNPDQSVEECTGNNMWFRQFLSDGFTPMRDHTVNNLTNAGPYGAMLMINYATTGDKVAFQHILTAEEKAQFSPNSILRFSAWFASAAKKEATAVLVNMALKIEFKAYGTSTWQQKAIIVTKVGYNDDWMRGEAELVLDEKDGDYRITIENYAGGGTGNDVLIDDISLDLCVPSFGVYFYEDNQDKTSVVLDKLSSSVPVRVENMDFGTVGANPCMMLFRYDETADQKYTYVADMALDPTGKYYVANISGTELGTIPGTNQFQAVASASPCDPAVKIGVENGTIKPGASDAYIFSGNKVNMTVNCGTSSLSLVGENKVCQGNTLPQVKLQSTLVGTSATYTVRLNNQAVATMQDKSFSTTTTNIDLNALPTELKTAGTKNITVEVKEMYNRQVICTRTTNAVSFSIEPRPTYNTTAFVPSHTLCAGTTVNLSVEAQNTQTYQWQLQKTASAAWENVGTNSAQYTTPANAQNGWKYQVILTNNNAANCSATTTATALNVEVCDNLSLTQSIAPQAVCLNERVEYTVILNNHAQGPAQNVKVKLNWDNSVLEFIQSVIPGPRSRFDRGTKEWIFTQNIAQGAEEKLVIQFKMKKKSPATAPAQVSAYVSSLGTSTWGSYDRQTSTTMKGTSQAITKEVATTDLYVAEDPSVCPGESVTIQVQTNEPNPTFRWYDMNGNLLATQATYTTPALTEDTSYKVTLETNDLCETPLDLAEVSTVDMKPVLTNVVVNPVNETISVGGAITKQLSVEPAGVDFDAAWFANGQELNLPPDQALAPQLKPFVNTQYRVVVKGACNSLETEAAVKVEWPTVFTPYTVDGKNDDFVANMDPAFPIVVFDRYGNKVAETDNGWDGTMNNGKKAMPGVYFYIVTLPDGNLQKGTIEIYQD